MSDHKYRIVKKQRYDEKCEVDETWYVVEQHVYSWFFRDYKWKTIKHPWYDCETDTTFKDIADVHPFIEKLKADTPRNEVTTEVVEHHD